MEKEKGGKQEKKDGRRKEEESERERKTIENYFSIMLPQIDKERE